ncbi:MAG: spermidine synthase [Alphaproteobacteria bacterium]|nr:spermidine synthase [Alphaproteobacteria bacterium]
MRFLSRLIWALAAVGLTAAAAQGGERTLLVQRESLYNNIYVYSNPPYVTLTFGYNDRLYTESTHNTKDDRELPVYYTRYMTAGLIYPKTVGSILEIGSGGGTTAWYLHRYLPNVPVTTVELDPEVAKVAKTYFGIKDEPNFNVVTRDGRLFLRENTEHYDLILIDAYRGPFVPFHLLTKEFYESVKAHLNESGVVVQNVEPNTMLFDAAAKTIGAVFNNVEFYLAKGNVVTVAYDGPKRTDAALAAAAASRQAEFKLRYDLTQLLSSRREPNDEVGTISADAKVLTDDFAPVETLKAIENHNRKWPSK